MSLTTQYIGGKQAIKRQRVALLLRLRRNFLLKLISLTTAVLLYFYVQQERNPMIPRVIEATIELDGRPADVEVDTDQPQIKVTVTGPQPVVEVLKESDIRVVADLRSVPTDKTSSEKVRLHYDIRLTRDIQSLLTFDPSPLPKLDVQVYPLRTRDMAVEAHYAREAPDPGYHYGTPVIRPDHVEITGRMDVIKRVARVVADATAHDKGSGIDGNFQLSARDVDNNPVEGITMDTQSVHITVPIQENPYSKIVSVSPIYNDQPQPGYRIMHIVSEPNQVRVAGKQDLIDRLSTLSTDEIKVHDMTENQVVSVPLLVPEGVQVSDRTTGSAITKVVVRITIEKVGAAPPPTSPTTSGPL